MFHLFPAKYKTPLRLQHLQTEGTIYIYIIQTMPHIKVFSMMFQI